MKYDQAMEDWKYLWAIAPADDMTGGYVDQEDLSKLLRNPTKRTATACLLDQIRYWFQVGPSREDRCGSYAELVGEHPELIAIYERHGEPYMFW